MAFVAIHARLAVLLPRLSAAASSLRSAPPRTRLSPLRTSTGHIFRSPRCRRRPCRARAASITASLDLTEDNVRQAIVDAKAEASKASFPLTSTPKNISLAQLFDTSVGITVDLAELDGPFVKLRLKGKFWHTRATVVARIGNYLKNRIPEILEVEIEDEDQLDDSPAAY
uniref:Uncharacterized protein n=1 Tax=Triticum aestivum TaxID=4565 RepID=Q2L3S9_WHEAT|nr:hypothetical protein [Triticum aestivum]CAJ19351.1 hypothetical protein [Triticum aestivum]